MKVKVIEDRCISCGYCASTCPEVFEIEDISSVKENAELNKYKEEIETAAEGCPTGAIEVEDE